MFRSPSTLVLLLLLALLPGVALAQNTGKLSGRVTDAQTGETLVGANVFLPEIQRGAATDLDGNYVILGIPVGTYTVRFSSAGFTTEEITDVEVSSGRTRTLDADLSSGAIGDGTGITVVYERPLIQNDAIGVPKVVTGEDIQNLPVRGVQDVASIQAGVVSNGDGDESLNIRGGRSEEVEYYIDGVKVIGSAAVPQQAIAEQEMLIGTIPPQYGDATAGIISISTRSGGSNFFGALEGITSEGLDGYGYNLASATIGGPIVPNVVSFFLSGQGLFQRDSSPWAIETIQLNDDLYNTLQSAPQVIRIARDGADPAAFASPALFEDDQFYYVGIPGDFTFPVDDPETEGVNEGAVNSFAFADILGVPVENIVGGPVAAYSLLGDDQLFSTRRSKDDPSTQYAGSGNLEFRPVTGVNLRIGGAYTFDRDRGFSFSRSLFNRDRFTTAEDKVARGYVNFRQVLSNTAFYQIQAEYSDRRQTSFPDEFGSDIRELIRYGDIDAPQNATAARYASLDANGRFIQQFQDGRITPGSAIGVTFSAPGTRVAGFSQDRQELFRASGSAQTQVGVHELSFGGEYESRTRRRWAISSFLASQFARRVADGRVEAPLSFDTDDDGVLDTGVDVDGDGNLDLGVTSYDQLPYATLGFDDPGLVTYYGYDYLGLNEVDTENLDEFVDGTNPNVAPYKPIYYGGYVRDRVEYRDLVIDLGLRLDVFDNNTRVLRDPYALVDIYRVADFSGGNITTASGEVITAPNVPGQIGSDFSFYQNNGTVVGYRDTNGRFFDANGEQITRNDIDALSGTQVVRGSGNLTEEAFDDYEPQLTIMPRIGVTFPVTDRALFFASYNVTSQRPSENAFETIQSYSFLRSGQGTLDNPNLKPETTTQYELGFRQRLGERAAVTLSGYYRTQRNKVTLRNLDDAFPSGYTTYTNQDFTTTKGVELGFELRRTRNLAINANYTLSFAEGTGSDSRTARIIAWRSQTGVFPETLAPLDFDQRHNVNVSLDYRLGDGEGPTIGGIQPLAGFGFNLLGVFKSGNPYTELDDQALESPIGLSTNGGAVGSVNGVYLPWTSRADLKVDRAFSLGGANLKGYVWVQNLFDQRNVFSVYRDTGLPNDDGYLSTNPDNVASLQTDLERDAYRYLYSQYVGGPVVLDGFGVSGGQLYGFPRRIRLGVTLDF